MLTAHRHIEGLALFTSTLAKHQHDRHAHGALSVIMLTQGAKSFAVERQRRAVHAGQIAIANPGEVHGCEFVNDNPWAHRTWYISAQLLTALSRECGFRDRVEIVSPVLDDPRTSALMIAAHVHSLEGDDLDCESAAVASLTHLLTRHGHAKRERHGSNTQDDATRRVARCNDMMHASLHLPLGLTDLARECGVSRFQVIRDFQRVLRMSPGDHQRALRMQRAKSLLASGTPISSVAASTGYSDQSHFARTFRKVYGMTPLQYANASRQHPWMTML
jgi:AraC-like DNA-binding protein